MSNVVTFLTQSKYYSPAFNGAIFDGPVRIYFAQYQENLALKFYFAMQKQLQDLLQYYKENTELRGRMVYVMLYPTQDTFQRSFDPMQAQRSMISEDWGDDHVIGINNPNEGTDFSEAFVSLTHVLSNWRDRVGPSLQPAADAQAL